jgi:hypothetical protein
MQRKTFSFSLSEKKRKKKFLSLKKDDDDDGGVYIQSVLYVYDSEIHFKVLFSLSHFFTQYVKCEEQK